SIKIKVLLFASLKDRAGVNRLALEIPDSGTLGELRAALETQIPALKDVLGTAVAAINQEFAFPEDRVKDGDEVAFFPPVSGGAWPEIFRIAAEPIDLNELTRAITSPVTGAVCLFSGAVRGETKAEGHLPKTIRLEYEAYEPMAVAKMRQVAAEIRERWPLVQGIAMVQRVGVLDVGEPTVLIACASGHRDQGCFEAARYGIDRLKEIVPVWKKEVGPDDSEWIEGSYLPTPEDKIP
ncbi:MAG TPA: molybdopterin converting factor subunit 1, partial [Aggregatilineales bacterium]|nr:molybdopterin converting factor subunit 1 [Aggregatilineales bacterium]